MQLLSHQNGMHHQHVVRLVDAMQDESYYYIVTPYLSGGDMFSVVEARGKKGLPPYEAAGYFQQACEG